MRGLGRQLLAFSPLSKITADHKSCKTTHARKARRYSNDKILQISKPTAERGWLAPCDRCPEHQWNNGLQSNEA